MTCKSQGCFKFSHWITESHLWGTFPLFFHLDFEMQKPKYETKGQTFTRLLILNVLCFVSLGREPSVFLGVSGLVIREDQEV